MKGGCRRERLAEDHVELLRDAGCIQAKIFGIRAQGHADVYRLYDCEFSRLQILQDIEADARLLMDLLKGFPQSFPRSPQPESQ